MNIEIRPCKGLAELDACTAMEIAVWGYAGGDVLPRRAFLVAQKIGGQVIGAFDEAGKLLGFLMALPGVVETREGKPEAYLHSHMLAVLPEARNLGLGTRLKLAQREEALQRGIRRIEWTFDPLEIKNAFLNIHKLGAIVRRYEPDFYGSSSSPLQGGLPTDRLVAEWLLDSPRVTQALHGAHRLPQPSAEIRVPAEIYDWKANADKRALSVQQANRTAFEHAFANGLIVSAFDCDEEGNGTYALEYPQHCELTHED